MDKKEHIKWHMEAHSWLDRLIADYLGHTGKTLRETDLLDLLSWSHKQTVNPDEKTEMNYKALEERALDSLLAPIHPKFKIEGTVTGRLKVEKLVPKELRGLTTILNTHPEDCPRCFQLCLYKIYDYKDKIWVRYCTNCQEPF